MRCGPGLAMCLEAAACGDNADRTAYVAFALGQPSFIQYREGDGAWQHPDLMTDGSFVLHGGYEFELVAVLDQGVGGFAAYELAATYDDASQWTFDASGAAPGERLAPTGRLACGGFLLGPKV